jgi:hypothetical protein
MVRAAAAGVIDYTRADPKDINWRLRHQLLISEVQRQELCRYLEAAQRDILAYVSNARLTPESFESMCARSDELLNNLKTSILPWLPKQQTETPGQKDTIDPETAQLIEKYKARVAAMQEEETQ